MPRELTFDSPIGPLTAVYDDDKNVVGLYFGAPDHPQSSPNEVAIQVGEYFQGKRRVFDLPLRPEGTEFQRSVWQALLEIPFGETRSYGWVAQRIGNPSAVRAVGAANGANPIALIIPCHRVIGADGTLTGYGGGLDIKAKLLEHEGVVQPALFP